MGVNDGPSDLPIPVLRPADHQVAGHRYDEGRLGSSVDESGRFYKPLQDGSRGNREIQFYEQLQLDEEVPPHIRTFFPKYFGTISIEKPSGGPINIHQTSLQFQLHFQNRSVISYGVWYLDKRSGKWHGIMEDLAHGFHHSSIIDLKIGFRTWYPEASEHNITKNKLKDMQTTSGVLGFRVSGMQVYDASSGTTFKADRYWARNLTVHEVTLALKRYVSSNALNETNPDAAFASSIYGGPHGVITQLEVLKNWFSIQTKYHFASSSVLLVYEGDLMSSKTHDSDNPRESLESNSVAVKLVDFAHTLSGNSSLDENFLEGLKSLISLLSSIVESKNTL